jgi:hypothetical protein
VTDSHEAEVGMTEALFREVNERIEDMNRGMAELSDGKLHAVCECGNPECAQQLSVPLDDYERVRGDPTQFIVIPGHELPAIETVVSRGDGYLVVRKEGGVPEEIAEATDPRR